MPRWKPRVPASRAAASPWSPGADVIDVAAQPVLDRAPRAPELKHTSKPAAGRAERRADKPAAKAPAQLQSPKLKAAGAAGSRDDWESF